MKPIFGIDITEDKKNESINGDEFITKTTKQHKSLELENKQADLEKTIEQSKLPLTIRIIQHICGFVGIIVLLSFIKGALSVGFKQAYQNAAGLVLTGIVCLGIYLILKIIAKDKERNVLSEQDAEAQVQEIQNNIQEIYAGLNVPKDAESVDVLVFKYKLKDGIPKAQSVGFDIAPYANLNVKLYRSDDKLCIADLENVYSFNLTDLTEIKTFKKKIITVNWNKDAPPSDEKFKQYQILVDNFSRLHVAYNVLEINCSGEQYGIFFPCYELPAFERVSGLKAQ